MANARRAVLLAFIAACCVACSAGAIARDAVIGDFQADYGFGIESLRFTRDGNYTQLFRPTGEDTWTSNSGTWEFKNDPPQIVLHDSLVIYDASGKLKSDYRQPISGLRTLRVQKSVRSISIVDDDAPGHPFKKLG